MMVTPKISKDDYLMIHMIAVRAAKEMGVSLMSFEMDLERVHGCGNPLRLQEMLEDRGADFIHDVAGITQHMNRSTGQLTDGFSPRFSV